MTCTSVQDDLKAYLDGELPLLSRIAVRRHLSGCAFCRQEIQEMQALQEQLRAGEEQQEGLDRDLRARILGAAAASGPLPLTKHRTVSPTLVWTAAALILFGCFVRFSALQTPPNNSNNPLAAILTPPAGARSNAQQAANPSLFTAHNDAVGSASQAASSPPNVDNVPGIDMRQVHKEASITVAVADPEAQSDAVEQMVKSSGGYVADNTFSAGNGGQKSAQMTLQVPEPQFELVLGQIAKLGDVQAKNITGQDITVQVSDAAQAENVLESEAEQAQTRLNKLGSKAKWVDDTEARDLRVELAQSQARLRLLQKMASLSTLSVTLNEKPKPIPPAASGFFSQLTGTTHDALGSLAVSSGAVFTILIWIAAYAPLWIPAALIGRRVMHRTQQQKSSGQP